MIVEVERGINNEIAHLRAGMPVAPGIPNFVMQNREPKVANGKEEFADEVEINEENAFEPEEYDESDEEEDIEEFGVTEEESVDDQEESNESEKANVAENEEEPLELTEQSKLPLEIEDNLSKNTNISFVEDELNSEKVTTKGKEFK